MFCHKVIKQPTVTFGQIHKVSATGHKIQEPAFENLKQCEELHHCLRYKLRQ